MTPRHHVLRRPDDASVKSRRASSALVPHDLDTVWRQAWEIVGKRTCSEELGSKLQPLLKCPRHDGDPCAAAPDKDVALWHALLPVEYEYMYVSESIPDWCIVDREMFAAEAASDMQIVDTVQFEVVLEQDVIPVTILAYDEEVIEAETSADDSGEKLDVEPQLHSEEFELEEIGIAEVAAAVGRVLEQLAQPGKPDEQLTFFHGVAPPKISIQDYVRRIVEHYQCSEACLVLALVFIDRIAKRHSDFVVSLLSIHRLFAVSVMVAAKFHSDLFYSNARYAKVAGLKVREMNNLEKKFLHLIEWQLRVTPREYDEYLTRVLFPGSPRKCCAN